MTVSCNSKRHTRKILKLGEREHSHESDVIVEDFPPIAKSMKAELRQQHHYVTHVGSVAGAMQLERAFDVAVLDINLPDGNGVALAQYLIDKGRANSVVFYTATRETDLLTRAASLGPVVDKMAGFDCLLMVIQCLYESPESLHTVVAKTTTTASNWGRLD